jgi:hypothetical protein
MASDDDDVFLGAYQMGTLKPYTMGTLSPYTMGRRRRRRHPLRDGSMSWASPYRPGIQVTDGAILPISFPTFSFALATGTNPITNLANPQTPFRGQRLSAQVIRNGTSAAATAPLLQQLLVGPKPVVLTTPGPALETFSTNAYDTNLILPPTYPGMQYTMSISLTSALTGTDTLIALVSLLGTSVL